MWNSEELVFHLPVDCITAGMKDFLDLKTSS